MRLPSPSPATWVKVHTVAAVIWALLLIPSLLWWKNSLIWVIAMSCYANFAGSMASVQAARADCNSPTREDLERLDHKISALMQRR
jgi:hypothetical protein